METTERKSLTVLDEKGELKHNLPTGGRKAPNKPKTRLNFSQSTQIILTGTLMTRRSTAIAASEGLTVNLDKSNPWGSVLMFFISLSMMNILLYL
jgi:hypothetical protein